MTTACQPASVLCMPCRAGYCITQELRLEAQSATSGHGTLHAECLLLQHAAIRHAVHQCSTPLTTSPGLTGSGPPSSLGRLCRTTSSNNVTSFLNSLCSVSSLSSSSDRSKPLSSLCVTSQGNITGTCLGCFTPDAAS
jgi:hypothetical protein